MADTFSIPDVGRVLNTERLALPHTLSLRHSFYESDGEVFVLNRAGDVIGGLQVPSGDSQRMDFVISLDAQLAIESTPHLNDANRFVWAARQKVREMMEANASHPGIKEYFMISGPIGLSHTHPFGDRYIVGPAGLAPGAMVIDVPVSRHPLLREIAPQRGWVESTDVATLLTDLMEEVGLQVRPVEKQRDGVFHALRIVAGMAATDDTLDSMRTMVSRPTKRNAVPLQLASPANWMRFCRDRMPALIAMAARHPHDAAFHWIWGVLAQIQSIGAAAVDPENLMTRLQATVPAIRDLQHASAEGLLSVVENGVSREAEACGDVLRAETEKYVSTWNPLTSQNEIRGTVGNWAMAVYEQTLYGQRCSMETLEESGADAFSLVADLVLEGCMEAQQRIIGIIQGSISPL